MGTRVCEYPTVGVCVANRVTALASLRIEFKPVCEAGDCLGSTSSEVLVVVFRHGRAYVVKMGGEELERQLAVE